jgi:RNA polymerase sigma-70 factor (ECF subfamily)
MTTITSENERRLRLAGLLVRCGEQHEPALEELYGLVSAQLFGVLMRILKLETIAQEALQETVVKIWEKADSYSPEFGAPMTWMTSIARHQALDTLRRRSVREDYERPQLAALIDDTADAHASLQAVSDDAEQLLHCLEQLEPGARDCIVKAYCEGYSHDELSAAHETPLGTVKSWIRRGLMSLRSCLDEFS